MNLKLLLVLILLPVFGLCQYNPSLSQIIKNPEFINPGYNASKDWTSGTILLSDHYTNGYGDGRNFAINLNTPINRWNTGLGLNFMVEALDNVDKINFDLNSYVDLRITKKTSLAFGICGGTQAIRYNIDDGYYIRNPNDSVQYINSNNLHVGFGINFFAPQLFFGASLHYLQANENTNGNNGLYTLYLNGSYSFELDEDLTLKPTALLSSFQAVTNFDYGIFAIYEDVVSLGVVHRMNRAISLHAGLKLFKVVRVGYSFDIYLKEKKNYYFGPHEFGMQIQMPLLARRNGKYNYYY